MACRNSNGIIKFPYLQRDFSDLLEKYGYNKAVCFMKVASVPQHIYSSSGLAPAVILPHHKYHFVEDLEIYIQGHIERQIKRIMQS